MTSYSATNERVKRQYFAYLAEALGHSNQAIDAVAKAIARFEALTKGRDFKKFHIEQAKRLKLTLAAGGPFLPSASERADPEMYALIQVRLAQACRVTAGGFCLLI